MNNIGIDKFVRISDIRYIDVNDIYEISLIRNKDYIILKLWLRQGTGCSISCNIDGLQEIKDVLVQLNLYLLKNDKGEYVISLHSGI
jgi:hypothetical protein